MAVMGRCGGDAELWDVPSSALSVPGCGSSVPALVALAVLCWSCVLAPCPGGQGAKGSFLFIA